MFGLPNLAVNRFLADTIPKLSVLMLVESEELASRLSCASSSGETSSVLAGTPRGASSVLAADTRSA